MIKCLIFDFGDVFINLDKPATLREFQQLEISALPDDILNLNQEYEKGMLSSEEFFQTYQTKFSHLTQENFTNSWNAILLNFPRHRLEFIKKLSEEKKYKLILLSNTNDIHISWVKETVSFFEEFKNCFDAFYLSHEINLRKPHPSIYKHVLKEHGLRPEETLFVDDTAENTEAASQLGIHTWTIDPKKEDVVDLFRVKKELF